MEFKRELYQSLVAWKSSKLRKPLIIMGARQIGKTTLLKAFGKEAYEEVVYLNFEKQEELHEFFKGNKDPQKILDRIGLLYGQTIDLEKTLFIFDEIQECRDALISLKYFNEELNQAHIISAGSLLGLSMGNDRSFPVGKVEFLDMYPLSFSEYLHAADDKLYNAFNAFLRDGEIEPLPKVFFNPLQKTFKEYVLFGSMPEVAAHYIEHKNIEEAQKIQDQILRAYALDFVNHADKTTSTRIQKVWDSIPSQLAKENKKFLYKVIRSGARAREYEEAIIWLMQAGLVYKVPLVQKAGIPLKAYEDLSTFKLYVFDTGLLIRLAGLEPETFIQGDSFFTEFKGAIAENYVAHALRKAQSKSPYYWTSEGKAEIDFLISHKSENFPIEVKSGLQTKAKSLSVFTKLYTPKLRIRISQNNLILDDGLLNVPLFYAEHLLEWVEMGVAT